MSAHYFKITLFSLIALVYVTQFVDCSPVILPASVPDPEEAAGFDEGDMVLAGWQRQVLRTGISGRNGLINEKLRWPDKTVVYKIIGDFEPSHIAEIGKAIALMEAKTCVRFREATPEDQHYVEIDSKPAGCFTAVGYQAKVQEMNLQLFPIGEGCFRFGTIIHEFMHALGFYHEQSSADRDDYIVVRTENIIPGKEFNFQKYSDTKVTDFDIGYDYDSCLHYRPGAFSVNNEDTIVPLDRNAKIGQRVTMSTKDIAKINVMYKCPIQA